MKKKSILAIVLVLALLLCACSLPQKKLSAKQVAEKFNAAMEENTNTKFKMTEDIKMTMGMMGMSLEIPMTMVTETTLCENPLSSYTNCTVDMTIFGESMTTVTELYAVQEDGAIAAYAKFEDLWLRLDDTEASDLTEIETESVNPATAVLDETVTTWQEQEVICLTYTMTGAEEQEEIADLVANVFASMEDLGLEEDALSKVDYSKITANVRYYLDGTTFLPVACEIELTGLEEALNSMLEEAGVTLSNVQVNITIEYLSYEPQAEILLPEGARESAVDADEMMAGQ